MVAEGEFCSARLEGIGDSTGWPGSVSSQSSGIAFGELSRPLDESDETGVGVELS